MTTRPFTALVLAGRRGGEDSVTKKCLAPAGACRPLIKSHNVRCKSAEGQKMAEKLELLSFSPDHKGYSRAALTVAWPPVAATEKLHSR